MTTQEYIDRVNTRFKTGISREHSYRGDLQNLLERIAPDVLVTNEPARVACGAPDYIITRGKIPVGYIEAKDVGADLNAKIHKEQFDRYRQSLNNLIITDYLTFQLYRDGEWTASVVIGEIKGSKIVGRPECYGEFEALMKDFCTHTGQTIRSASKLSKMMAGKARLLANVIEKALVPAEEDQELHESGGNTLHDQYRSFQQILIHDITEKTFADIYAQTIAYGMFAARLHDPSLENFSRMEAAELIPKSNPFLRKLFQYIAGYDLDDRIKWIVDALADIFRATNVAELLQDFGKATQQNDPMIHFYETFLSEYDPKLRKSRGVWYTPEPVVNFIVRAVDDILKTEFGLPQGLADTSTTRVKVDVQGKKVEKEVHKVQILDPAAGTGAFLAEVVKHIYKQFEEQQGIWNSYVEQHLIPRLNGFEILMASYAMAHLKLDLLLRETGFTPTRNQRFRVYLTNSLEEHHPDTGTLFASWLSAEANEANHIKRDTPVMVVLGNPPYSGESVNKGEWIMKLMEDYKKEPGGKEKLKERNPKWINDDYVKFMRYGQYLIEKNGEGILAFINPHGFLDNPTFRGMRWNLLKTFDKIYTIDLHGNSKKKETAPDGGVDENVFDIQQGVSINFLIKKNKNSSKKPEKVYHYDVYGERESKYLFLLSKSLSSIAYKELNHISPNFFFLPKELDSQEAYNKGFSILDCFIKKSLGIATARDAFTVHLDRQELESTIRHFLSIDNDQARNRFSLGKDARDWTIENAKKDLLRSNLAKDNFVKISYRPFDERYTYYTGKSKGFHCMPRGDIMDHMKGGSNIAINFVKVGRDSNSQNYFLSKHITDKSLVSSLDNCSCFPLYMFPNQDGQLNVIKNILPNLNQTILHQLQLKLSSTFTPEKEPNGNVCMADNEVVRPEYKESFAPIDLLDYIYAILHHPGYREKYKEFLKIDFPRIPYPKDQETFWKFVKLGGQLRQFHLLESPVVEKPITTYPEAGNHLVEKPRFELPSSDSEPWKGYSGKVWINDNQYFADVPQVAWEFYIGGYQPAQKWLKDRKGRNLNFEDIVHYQKIIVALTETDGIMKEIAEVDWE